MAQYTTPEPFTINVPDSILTDLQERLDRVRWPGEVPDTGWDYGANLAYLKELVEYWRTQYDWRTQERAINRWKHFRTTINGQGVHFIHERGKGPNPFPLILTHGYPDSFYRFAKIIPLLTDPGLFGGRAEDASHVVVPDLPGYGFSDKPAKTGTVFRVNDLWSQLMTAKLGYKHFGAHGGDWGSTVTEQLARSHPDSVVAIHLTDVPFGHLLQKPDDPSCAERKLFKKRNSGCKRKEPTLSYNPANRRVSPRV